MADCDTVMFLLSSSPDCICMLGAAQSCLRTSMSMAAAAMHPQLGLKLCVVAMLHQECTAQQSFSKLAVST